MPSATFRFDDLKRILLEGSGAPEGIELNDDMLDTEFADLGYDSVAMLETASRVEREYGVSIDESQLADATTPRSLLSAVTKLLGQRTAA